MKPAITDSRMSRTHAGDGIAAVSISSDSVVNAVMVNGQLLSVGGVVYTNGQPIRLTRPPWLNHTDDSPGALVSLHCWEPGELPFPVPVRGERRDMLRSVVPYAAALPTAPAIKIPMYGRRWADVVIAPTVSTAADVEYKYAPIKYARDGRAIQWGASKMTTTFTSPVSFDDVYEQWWVVAHIDALTGDYGSVDELWLSFRKTTVGPDVDLYVAATTYGDLGR